MHMRSQIRASRDGTRRGSRIGVSISQTRLKLVMVIGSLLWLGILLRLGYWQIWKHRELSAAAAQQYQRVAVLQTQRGEIQDRAGRVLAGNQELYTLFAEPQQLDVSPAELADRLLPILEQSLKPTPIQATDEAWIRSERERIRSHITNSLTGTDRKWLSLWSQLSRGQKEAIEALQLRGVGHDVHTYRYYPDASVSAHVLGFVGKNEFGEDTGYFGVEGLYDLELRGREGRVSAQRTALGLPIALGSSQRFEAEPGHTVRLTIDKSLQYQIEQSLKAGIERYGAEAGEVVVMDPHTGAILALAAFPNYDPQSFIEFDPGLYRNPSVSDLYEPGSTFKVLTVAAGIEEGVINPDTTCDRCSGPRVISGFSIKTWNEVYNPNVSMRDALAKSDNTAMVFIQELLGKERFLYWLRRFGIDAQSGIDLQGEAQPSFRDESQWRTIDVATASFGQGVSTTSVSLVRAVAAIANGGKLMRPYVVESVIDQDGEHQTQPQVVDQVLSPETAQTVTEMMVYSASQGDAKWTADESIQVAGKTGTAQIAEGGKYLEDKTLTSFIGFAPADNPRFVMLVKLRAPTSSPWGSETAAPLWYEIAPALLE